MKGKIGSYQEDLRLERLVLPFNFGLQWCFEISTSFHGFVKISMQSGILKSLYSKLIRFQWFQWPDSIWNILNVQEFPLDEAMYRWTATRCL